METRDPDFANSPQRWFQGIIANVEVVSFLAVDQPIAEQAADFRALLDMSYNGSLIAASAKVHHLTLATRNNSDFVRTGISLINPWDK